MTSEHETEWRPGCLILAWVILCAGIAATVYIIKTKPKAGKEPPAEQVLTVDAVTLSRIDTQIVIRASGTVIPAREIALSSEISGRIEWISPRLTPGTIVRRGEPLIRLDNRNYIAETARQEAAVETARLNLRVEEGRKAVAEEEWQLLEEEQAGKSADRELILREPQIESARAQLKAAESALAKARADLERTEIMTPFDAVILDESVDEGAYLTPSVVAARLVGADEFRVRASVPVADLQWLNRTDGGGPDGDVRVALTLDPQRRVVFEGEIIQWLADLDAAGRMAQLLISIPDPFGQAPDVPLFLNAYVEVLIAGKSVTSVYHIPRAALHDGAVVWIIDEDHRLTMREVEIVRLLEHTALVRNGLEPGMRLITSRISLPMEGMQVQTRDNIQPFDETTAEPGLSHDE